ncbi:MAG: hypothetical protein HYU39_04670 [Thaumarchaeota archaeon]|nr:hypothetical protein [Nitrososphaerota archaeon]
MVLEVLDEALKVQRRLRKKISRIIPVWWVRSPCEEPAELPSGVRDLSLMAVSHGVGSRGLSLNSVSHGEGNRDLALLSVGHCGGHGDLALLAAGYGEGNRDLALCSVGCGVSGTLDPDALHVNPSSRVRVSVSMGFTKWNDISDTQISTATVATGMVLDVGLTATRDHIHGGSVTCDTLKAGSDGTAEAASQTDVLNPLMTWGAALVAKSKPAANKVKFESSVVSANRLRSSEPAPGGSNSITVREGALTSYARAVVSAITLTWTKDAGGVDTVKESLSLAVTISFDRASSPTKTRFVDKGLEVAADALKDGSAGMPNRAALGTVTVNPTDGDTALGGETGIRLALSRTQIGLFAERLSGSWAAGNVDAGVGECGLFNNSTNSLFVRCTFSLVDDDAVKFHVVDALIEVSR